MANILVSVLMFVVPFIAYAQAIEQCEIFDPQAIITSASLKHDEGLTTEAIELLRIIRPSHPSFLEAQLMISRMYFEMEQVEVSLAIMDSLYQTDARDSIDFLIYYGLLLRENESFDAAFDILTQALKLAPYSYQAHFQLAIYGINTENIQLAIDHLKKVVYYDPNHVIAHYLLGGLLIENGKVAAGSLAVVASLLLNPTSEVCNHAITLLNTNFGTNYLEVSDLKHSESGDDFSFLEEIYRNQLPLRPKYPLKTKFDAIYTRQVQALLEYASIHNPGSGFFEQLYIPILADIYNRDYTEAFLLYSLTSNKDVLEKKYTSRIKIINEFDEKYVKSDFWKLFAQRKLSYLDSEQTMIIWLEDYEPYWLEPNDSKDEENNGVYFTIDKHHRIINELNYENGKLQGVQKAFFPDGILREESIFKDDLRHGLSRYYYKNGQLDYIENYENGNLHGPFQSYSANGQPFCELQFHDGKLEGLATCFHPDGSLSTKRNFSKGELNGEATYYNELGDLVGKYLYNNGMLHDTAVSYYDGNKIKSIAQYKNGTPDGDHFQYFANGKVQFYEKYDSQNLVLKKDYYSNGTLEKMTQIDTLTTVVNITYYDMNGEIEFEESYKNSNLESIIQHYPDGGEPTIIDLDHIEIKNLLGKIYISGSSSEGKPNGTWKYYYHTSIIKEINYKIGSDSTGYNKSYDKTGKIKKEFYSEENGLCGKVINYDEGLFQGTEYFENGVFHGPFTQYYPSKKLSLEGNYVRGELNGKLIFYNQEGISYQVSEYIKDTKIKSTYLNKVGKIESVELYDQQLDSMAITCNNGHITHSNQTVFGINHGKGRSFYSDGTLISDVTYINGKLNGSFKKYHPNGQKHSEIEYYCGALHGDYKVFDLLGNMWLNDYYIHGLDNGYTQRFYHNGNMLYDYSSVSNFKHGSYHYYNLEGDTIAAIQYYTDVPIAFKVLQRNGLLGEWQETKGNSNIEINSFYSNGKTAFKCRFRENLWDGTIELYSERGNLIKLWEYDQGTISGEAKEFFANGQLYKSTKYKNGKHDGQTVYYDIDGKKVLSADYSQGELHGNFITYRNGIIAGHKIFDSDELVDIQE